MVDTQDKQETLDCNCRVKAVCSLKVNCRKESVIYKCTAITCDLKKVSLGLTEGEFKKQRYYDHINSFGNEFYADSTTLLSYLWEMENGKTATPTLTWEILWTPKAYSNIRNNWSLLTIEENSLIPRC